MFTVPGTSRPSASVMSSPSPVAGDLTVNGVAAFEISPESVRRLAAPAASFTTKPSCGSSTPTTADTANGPSASSPPSNFHLAFEPLPCLADDDQASLSATATVN